VGTAATPLLPARSNPEYGPTGRWRTTISKRTFVHSCAVPRPETSAEALCSAAGRLRCGARGCGLRSALSAGYCQRGAHICTYGGYSQTESNIYPYSRRVGATLGSREGTLVLPRRTSGLSGTPNSSRTTPHSDQSYRSRLRSRDFALRDRLCPIRSIYGPVRRPIYHSFQSLMAALRNASPSAFAQQVLVLSRRR
jgi:hypothetical protein